MDERTHEERQTILMEKMLAELSDIKMVIYGVIMVWVVAGIFLYVAINHTESL